MFEVYGGDNNILSCVSFRATQPRAMYVIDVLSVVDELGWLLRLRAHLTYEQKNVAWSYI